MTKRGPALGLQDPKTTICSCLESCLLQNAYAWGAIIELCTYDLCTVRYTENVHYCTKQNIERELTGNDNGQSLPQGAKLLFPCMETKPGAEDSLIQNLGIQE